MALNCKAENCISYKNGRCTCLNETNPDEQGNTCPFFKLKTTAELERKLMIARLNDKGRKDLLIKYHTED